MNPDNPPSTGEVLRGAGGRGRWWRASGILTACAALLVASGGSDGAVDGVGGDQVAPTWTVGVVTVAPLSMTQVAARSGCTPRILMDVDEYSSGACTTADGEYVVATFATERHRRDWLEFEQTWSHGSVFLVGDRWVVKGEPAVLAALRPKLGGEISS